MIERLNAALDGRYRIEREIGAGGMATVYVALDERHDRRVALKVLRAELAALVGAERFLAEIRTTAALQHPHILPLFDSGEADGFLFFVMPYVEGDTLRDRLERETQLPIDEAVRIAAEAADALDYAHRRGIVHRDVKPANILLHDGRALVADFGIALAVRQAGGDRFTETGLSLGTPHYMSPEQAAGDRSVDGRADVYALGCVLYEMLAGQPPHVGPSAQAVLAKVLTAEPRPVSETRHKVPAHLDATVMKALEKLPADRFAGAGDFARALRDPAAAPVRPVIERGGRSDAGRSAGAVPRLSRRVLIGSNLTLLIALLALGLVVLLGSRDDGDTLSSPWVTRLVLDVDASSLTSPPTLSPDGRLVALSLADGVHVRSFDRLESRPIPGTVGARSLGISADGRQLSYIVGRQLFTVALDGGMPRMLVDGAAGGPNTNWSDDGWIYFRQITMGIDARSDGSLPADESNVTLGLARVDSRSGLVEPIELADSILDFVLVSFLPDGRHALGTFRRVTDTAQSTADEAEPMIAVLDISGGEVEVLTRGRIPRYERNTGLLLFLRNETLIAAPFDSGRRERTGSEFVVMASVGAYGLARDGTLLAVMGRVGGVVPALLDRRGQPRELLAGVTDHYDFGDAYVSPDGDRLVLEMVSSGEDSENIWIYDLPDGPLTQLTFDRGMFPAWTLDGRGILFTRTVPQAGSGNPRTDPSGNPPTPPMGDGVYLVPADATGPPRLLLRADGIGWLQPTPDGGVIFERWNGSDFDVGYAALDGGDSIRVLVSGPANEEDPAISPDGRCLAYESDETGRPQVYVMPFESPGRGQQVSIAGGNNPVWANSGQELFFVNGQRVLESLRMRTDPACGVVARDTLFSAGRFEGRFQPAPGDSLFLAKQSGGARFTTRLEIVRNWIRELEARAAEARR